MNRLDELYRVTKQLEDILNVDITVNNRQDVIDKVNILVEKRSKHMDDLTPPYTDNENKLGQQLLVMNHQIQKKLDLLFENLKEEMKQMKQQKKSAQSYITPYEKLGSADGMFMDLKE